MQPNELINMQITIILHFASQHLPSVDKILDNLKKIYFWRPFSYTFTVKNMIKVHIYGDDWCTTFRVRENPVYVV